MDNKERIILVTGATGKQGGAVAHHLLVNGWKVRALTRDPSKLDAQALVEMGAEVVKGDLEDRASLDQALEGVYGVFSMQDFWEHGYDGEVRQGKTLADAAKVAGVEHLVYSSVGSAERNTGIPHFDSKWEVEQYIRAQDLPVTILRPVFFMENFNASDFRSMILGGTLMLALRSDKPLQMIAVDDIGAFATLAFENPEEFIGKATEIAGEEITMPQAAELFSRVIDRPVQFVEMSIERLRGFNEEYAVMFEWFNDEGYQADLPALRALHPQLTTFETWLSKDGWDEAEAKSQ
ncbi:MAG: NmrA/HSCARG family protein [Candidatus Bipolaricaulia bacterium]